MKKAIKSLTILTLYLTFTISIGASSQVLDNSYNQNEDTDSRIENSRQFVLSLPQSFDSETLLAIEQGLQDPVNEVILNYIYAFYRAAQVLRQYAFEGTISRPDEMISVSLSNRLHSLLNHTDAEIATNAASVLLLVGPRDRDLEIAIFSNVIETGKVRDSKEGFVLIQNLAIGGPLTNEFQEWLFESVSDESYSIAEVSALTYRRKEDPPIELLPKLISLLERPVGYANGNILRLLEEGYLSDLEPYRSRLQSMLATIDQQLTLSPFERSFEMWNAEFSRDLLEGILAQL